MKSGTRNLVLLGVASVTIAVVVTGVSLFVYHKSGDIYLDRSRPGYLPDEEEIEQDEGAVIEEYNFDKTGAITKEVLDEYLEHLDAETKALDAYTDPFGAEALSDARLGIDGTKAPDGN
ncbi:hypothetical protein IJG04_00595 [Candidatus Saccharibacteria bacterium]|nr:hypothetical protein [Candidatus Saccharibacteria bacterium]